MILQPSYLHNGIPYTSKTFLLSRGPGHCGYQICISYNRNKLKCHNHSIVRSRGTYQHLNPLRVKLFRGNTYTYLHSISLPHIDMTQVVEILPHVRQGPTYFT